MFQNFSKSTTVRNIVCSSIKRNSSTTTTDFKNCMDMEFKKSINSVLIIKKWQSKSAIEYAKNISNWLTERNIQVFVEPTTVKDYDVQYPTILDLIYHSDPKSAHHFNAYFPNLTSTQFIRNPSLAQALVASGQPVDSHHLSPLSTFNFWNDGFERDEEVASAFANLDPRECISFARRHNTWQDKIDVIISIGGDGTLLHVSSLFPHKVPPTLAFGCGSFGFLMPFNPDKHEFTLNRLIAGDLKYFNRARIAFKVGGGIGVDSEGAEVVPAFRDDDPHCFHILNEVVLKHSYGLNVGTGISEIECRVDGALVARYQGDGVILASPTGSTAYSMAVGGSIVHPAMNCLLVSPIAPMTLSSRPLILPGQCTVTLKPLRDSVLLEGKYGRVIQPGECVTVRQSDYPIPVFTRNDATDDFIHDLGARLNYARMIRFKRVEDDINAEAVPQGPVGSFVSKREPESETRTNQPNQPNQPSQDKENERKEN